MKKALKVLIIAALSILLILTVTACKKDKAPTPDGTDNVTDGTGVETPAEGSETGTEPPAPVDNSVYFNVFDDDIDVYNEQNRSVWSSIPLVSQAQLDAGYTGGEGCQRLAGLARSESDPNLMFLGTDVGGLFKSTDGGRSWKPCNKGLDRRGVGQIVIDPRNSNHVVVTSTASGETSSKYFSAISYSFDAGETWHSCADMTGTGISAAHCYYNTLAFDADSFDINLGYCTDVYYSTPYKRDIDPNTHRDPTRETDQKHMQKAGLHKSTDGGVTFTKIYGEMTADYTCLAADGQMVISDGRIIMGNQHGLFVEENNELVRKNDLNVESLLKLNGTYYILTSDGIYRAGEDLNFVKTESNNFPSIAPRNLEISALDPDKMILSAQRSTYKYSERIFYSHDGGLNWTLVNLSGSDAANDMFYGFTWGVSSYSFNNTVPGEVVGTTANAAIISSDYGASWGPSNNGVANAMVGGKFAFNIYDSDLIYMGIQDFGGALTTDGGRTWKNISLSKDGDGRDIYGGYAADENTLIGVYTEQWADGTKRANERYVCVSHDGGKTVNVRKEDLTDPSKAEYLKSININNKILTRYESSYQSPNDRNILFCANYRSTDNGYTWADMMDESRAGEKCLQVYTHYGKTLYGCSLGGYVLKSDDDGATWQKVNTTELKASTSPNATQKNHIIDIAVDGQNGYIYAIYSKKLYRMDIDGSNVKNLSDKMSKDNWGTVLLNTVTVDPYDSRIVYCGGSGDMYLSDRGLRRSCDCGETWQVITPSLAPDSIVRGPDYGYETICLRVHPVTGELWNGSSCLGFNKLTPPYPTYDATVRVYYHLGYDNMVGVYRAGKGQTLKDFYAPVRDGYTLDGWYTDEALSERYVFSAVNSDLHLYAKWTEK